MGYLYIYFKVFVFISTYYFFFKDFIYLFLEKEGGRRKERERNINAWLPLTHPLLGTWPETQACTLTGNWTSDPLVRRPGLNLLSHTSQSILFTYNLFYMQISVDQPNSNFFSLNGKTIFHLFCAIIYLVFWQVLDALVIFKYLLSYRVLMLISAQIIFLFVWIPLGISSKVK